MPISKVAKYVKKFSAWYFSCNTVYKENNPLKIKDKKGLLTIEWE
jgi:hypothetical protein